MLVKVFHIQDSIHNIYHFKLPKGSYEINNKTYTVQDYKGEELTAHQQPKIFSLFSKKEITNFRNKVTGELISRETYENLKGSLLSKAAYNDDLEFDNLEDEFAYKKFERDWEVDTTSIITSIIKKELEIEAHHVMLETGNQYISTIYNLDAEVAALYVLDYKQLEMDTVKQWGTEHPEVKLVIPSHGHLEFIQVNGKYANFKPKYNTTKKYLSLQQAQGNFTAIVKDIRGHLDGMIRGIPQSSVTEIVLELAKLKGEVLMFTPSSQKGKTIQASILNNLESLIGKIKNV
jgi:hypothetical protein